MKEPQNAKDLLDRLLPLVISSSNDVAPLISPLNGALISQVPISSRDDIDTAFKRARSTFTTWSKVSLNDRIAIINRFHDLVLNKQAEILD
ncbi:MAG: aldehyde dehydrogenase family protein, partial [Candidatus Nanopelagicales bacterium]